MQMTLVEALPTGRPTSKITHFQKSSISGDGPFGRPFLRQSRQSRPVRSGTVPGVKNEVVEGERFEVSWE